MSTASLLVLALAGLLLVTSSSICGGSAAHGIEQCRGDPVRRAPGTGPTVCGECCKPGHLYPTYRCSPPVSRHTRAIMTLNYFYEGGDIPSYCDNQFHTNRERVVSLSTGWFANDKRCLRDIRIQANGRSVLAKVVDECDSLHGCDSAHDYEIPCRPNIIGASQGVWDALNITGNKFGEYPVTWSDA